MIARKTPTVEQLRSFAPPMLALLAWDGLIVVAYEALHWTWVGSSHIPLSLYGSAVGIIVAFRNNMSYARWWEARTLWGAIVNDSRSLGRQVCAAMRPNPGSGVAETGEMLALREQIVHRQIAFVHALRQQLRGLDPLAEVRRILPPEELAALAGQKNVSLSLQLSIAAMLRQARERGWIDNWEWLGMDGTLSGLMNAQGGAERIKNTPMPMQYVFFPMLFVQTYCLMLPIGMVENLGWFTPLGSSLVGFFFLALEKIGRDLEDPFHNAIFDVPLTAITKTIEINLRQLLGETELPPPQNPDNGVLW